MIYYIRHRCGGHDCAEAFAFGFNLPSGILVFLCALAVLLVACAVLRK